MQCIYLYLNLLYMYSYSAIYKSVNQYIENYLQFTRQMVQVSILNNMYLRDHA